MTAPKMGGKPSRPKVQHFVASSYLKGFVSGSGRKAKLYVYERGSTEPFTQGPEKAARRTNYYSFRHPDGTLDDSVEMLLQEVESHAIPSIRRMSAENIQLDRVDRSNMATFIAMQELRTPWTRENVESVYAQMMDTLTKVASTVPGYFERYVERLKKDGADRGVTAESLREFLKGGKYTVTADPVLSLRHMLRQAPLLHEFYVRMLWTVLRSDESYLVTSDHPVVKRDPRHESGFYGTGLASRDIEITFPLSQKSCLLITHDRGRLNKWQELMKSGREDEAKRLNTAAPDIRYVTIREETVRLINELTVRSATRWVYSPRPDPDIPSLLEGPSEALRMTVASPGA